MAHYFTKKVLYQKVEALRRVLGEGWSSYPLCVPGLCEADGAIRVGELSFSTPGLKGISCFTPKGEPDIILLNEKASREDRNFICAHELLHLSLHRGIPSGAFQCFETARPNQDAMLEWQANEGAAELLLPAAQLLPAIRRDLPCPQSADAIVAFRKRTAQAYGVAERVVAYRLESLKYEIAQYLSGVPAEKIQCLSRYAQKQRGIVIESLNDMACRLAGREEAPKGFRL